MARTGAHTSQMAHFRLDPYLHSPGPIRFRRTGISNAIRSTGASITLPEHKPHGNRRLHIQIFVISWPKNMQRTCKTPAGMLPQHYCMRVSLYRPPTGLRTPSKSYGFGTTCRSHVIRHYALVRWVGPVGFGKQYGPVVLETILLRYAWSHAYGLSTGSLCALSHGSQNACPYGFSKVYKQMSYWPVQMQYGFWNTGM